MAPKLSSVRRFPPGFLLGTATAAHQVEGNNTNSDWWKWERVSGNIKDGTVSGIAVDHYNRYLNDLTALAAAGHTTYRFSIEWARVEPTPGHYDQAALDHYADVIKACRRLGLEPIVTLHHFTLPQWVADRGSIHAPGIEKSFGNYARVCAEKFGADVKWWVTLNEPTILAQLAYGGGDWPPAQKGGYPGYLRALSSMLRMHGAGAEAVRDVARRNGHEALVSVAHHERPFRPLNPNSVLDRQAARLPNYMANRLFLHACQTGKLLPPLGFGQPVRGTKLDYIAVNYYTEEVVKVDMRKVGGLFAGVVKDPSLPTNAYGWTIDPPALTRALLGLHRDFGLPLMITENGVSDQRDELRPKFIVNHMDAVMDAIAAGADVRGYAFWSAWDNFEWKEGFSQKFGLYSVDPATLRRVKKPSADVFTDICHNHGIRSALRSKVARSPIRPDKGLAA